MRNIIGLIQRFYVFLLFLGLLILSVYILLANNNYHHAEFMRQSNDLVGGIYSNQAKLREYLRLDEINDSLSLDNAKLRSQRAENFYIERTSVDTLRDTSGFQRFTYRSARVVNYSVNRAQNYIYITLDRGTKGDVKTEMGVISYGAVVGKVVSVSDHFAVVMPVLHKDFRASVKHKRSGTQGVLMWPGGDPGVADVIEIPKNLPVELGDSIVTTGYSSYFPRDLMVGVVEEILAASDDKYHLLRVRLAVDFRKIDYVEVISDILRQEQLQLEQQTEDATDYSH